MMRFPRMERRWAISLMGLYSCGLMFGMRAALSVAMVYMTRGPKDPESESQAPEFDWNETTQGMILGATFYLYWFVPTIVGGFTDKYGGKWFVFTGVLMPGLLIAITPLATRANLFVLIAVQALIGAFHGFVYPALFSLYIQWFDSVERPKANAGIQVGNALGSAVMYMTAGYLCESRIGWPLVFYVMAALHLPWIAIWLVLGENKPPQQCHQKIIEKPREKGPIPWLQILTSKVVWSSILCKSACSYGYFMLLAKLPSYLESVHGMKIVQNGHFNAFSQIAYGAMAFLAPYLSGWMIRYTRLRRITVRKLFQTVAMMSPAFAMILITLVDTNATGAIVILIVAMFGYGCVTAGEWATLSDYAPNFCGTIIGITHMLAFSTGILAPAVVGLVIDSDAGTLQSKWNIVFYSTASFYFIGNGAFLIFGTDQQQEWDQT